MARQFSAKELYTGSSPVWCSINFALGVTVVGSLLSAYTNREENGNELLDHERLEILQVLPVCAL